MIQRGQENTNGLAIAVLGNSYSPLFTSRPAQREIKTSENARFLSPSVEKPGLDSTWYNPSFR